MLSLKQMKDIYKIARERVPEHNPIVFPNAPLEMQKFLLDEGATDLSVFENNISIDDKDSISDKLFEYAEKNNKELLKRFALRKDFIFHEKYSKKLGQVFDSYKYKIKKQIQEKLKEAKQ